MSEDYKRAKTLGLTDKYRFIDAWNSQADESNQWHELDTDEGLGKYKHLPE